MRESGKMRRTLEWIVWLLITSKVIVSLTGGTASCLPASPPVNGNVDVDSSVAAYTCNIGYNMVGINFALCQNDSTWSNTAPTCVIKDCGTVSDPTNGRANWTATTYESVVTYRCLTGYEITSGTVTRHCTKDEVWNGTEVTCTIVDCGSLQNITNGTVDFIGTTFGSNATYTCVIGYSTADTILRTCESSGNWSGIEPTCTIVDCGTPSSPVNGSIDGTSAESYGSVVTYKCDTGHVMNGSTSGTCQADGSWETAPTCVYTDCGRVTSPANGSAVYSITYYTATANFTCDSGFTLSGSELITCQANASWSDNEPNCDKVDCGTLEDPSNGNVMTSGTRYQDVATYTCNSNYRLDSNDSRTCLASGQWESSAPNCNLIIDGSWSSWGGWNTCTGDCSTGGTMNRSRSCDSPSPQFGGASCPGSDVEKISYCSVLNNPRNGTVQTPGGTAYLQNATYDCDMGFNLNGTASRQCENDSFWSNEVPTCDPDDCGTLTDPDNGNVSVADGTTYLHVAIYTCSTGFYVSAGNETRTCDVGGNWTGTEPTCTIWDCGQPQNISSSSVTNTNTTYGSNASYVCDTGYNQTTGNQDLMCGVGGSWTGTPITCIILDCGPLTNISNGAVSTSGATTYLQNATYACDTGHILSPPVVRLCQENGTWSGTEPNCTLSDCGPLSNIVEGTVTVSRGTTFAQTATYSCNLGFDISSGDSNRTCQVDGNWNGTAPTCTRKNCGLLTDPNNGRVSSPGTLYEDAASYTCNTGYERSGVNLRKCESSGQWADSPPNCTIYDCGALNSPSNGTVSTPGGTTYLQNATYSCDVGLNLNGTVTRQCQDRGSWSDIEPVCYPDDCGELSGPTNGNVSTASGTTYLQDAVYMCHLGFYVSGNERRSCQVGGNWNGTDPTCELWDCGQPQNRSSSSVTNTNTTYGNNASYVCDTGYNQTAGNQDLMCGVGGSWTGTPITCTILDCGPLTNISNGAVSTSGATTYLQNATYTCDTGYILSPPVVRLCQENGTWSGTEPNCTLSDCGPLSNIVAGTVTVSRGTTFAQTATYSCNLGFDISSGDSNRTCQVDGNWNGTAPTCTRKNCGQLTDPSNGRVSAPGTLYEDAASYTCNTGYERSGVNLRKCESSGQWADSPPNCTIHDCGALNSPSNGTVSTPGGTTYLQNATYSCDVGLNLNGTVTRQCQDRGSWSDIEPVCYPDDCGELSGPTNGNVSTASGTTYLQDAVYMCHLGFYVSGNERRSCQVGGNWNGTDPTCELWDCGQPQNRSSSSVTNTNTTYGNNASYVCDTGYNQTAGNQDLMCGVGGSWTGTPITCTILDCGPLTNVNNGAVSTSGATTYLQNATYTCDTGHILSPPVVRLCQENGTWSGTEPNCTLSDCGPLSSIVAGTVTVSRGTTFAQTATYSCNLGFDMTSGDSNQTCQGDGNWNGTAPTCTRKNCGPLTDPSNGRVSAPGTLYEDAASYTCNTGYERSGVNLRKCESSGQWADSPPNCTIYDCGALNSPSNGTVSTPGGTTYLQNATYSCDVGFNLNGTVTRQCQDGGSWSDIEPVCYPDDCGELSGPTNGNVTTASGTTYLQDAVYMCHLGFYVSGNERRSCQVGGNWSGTDPTCELWDCGQPKNMSSSTVSYSVTTYGNNATYTCDIGHRQTAGHAYLSCGTGGNWTGIPITCTIQDCGNLTNPSNGTVDTPLGTTYLHNATYRCNTGYNLNISAVRQCQDDATWGGTQPVCYPDDCGTLASVDGGTVSTAGGTTYTLTAIYTCTTGYRVTAGDLSRTCEAGGSWNGSEPTCTIWDCGQPANISRSSVTYNSTTYGNAADYRCDVGHRQTDGDANVTCDVGGNWTGTPIICTVQDCGNLTNPSNGTVDTPLGTTYLQNATYRCNTGYNLNISAVRHCQDDATWSGTQPVCYPDDCGTLASINGGTVSTSGGTTYTLTAIYTCTIGYRVTAGDLSRTCEAGGSWNGSEPTCTIWDCGQPGNISNNAVTYSNTTYGNTANYTCDIGYRLTAGDSYLTCEIGGSWTGTPITCTLQDCGNLTNPSNGTVDTPLGTTYLQNATYRCNTGYNLNISAVRQCQDDATWSGTQPVCYPDDCGTLASVDGGTVSTAGGTTYTLTAIYTCTTGYRVTAGDLSRTCEAGGSWNGSEPICTIWDCGEPQVALNSTVTYNSTTYPNVATYTCDVGHRPTAGDANLTCETGGSWTGIPITCTVQDCGPLNNISNGEVSLPGGTTFPNPATYTCAVGYNLDISDVRLCQDDGTWSSREPVCTLSDCGPLSSIVAGTVTISRGTTFAETAVYSCNLGFNMTSGDSQRTCLDDGNWNGTAPTCSRKDCGPLTDPSNGRVSTRGTLYEDAASYTCNTGYEQSGVNSRQCESSGQWADSPPNCTIYDCGFLPNPRNGTVLTPGGTTYLQNATYSCDSGYNMNGTATRQCENMGLWSGIEPVCYPVDCGHLLNISGGSVTVPGGTTFSLSATYRCFDGYHVTAGNLSRTCKAGGNWSGTEPTCTIWDCGTPPGVLNGALFVNGTTYGEQVSYICNIGYTMTAGNVTRTCGIGGTWSGTLVTCTIRDCGFLSNPRNGTVSTPGGTTYLQNATYLCDTGFNLNGTTTQQCEGDGFWSDIEPVCYPDDCGQLLSVSGGSVTIPGGTTFSLSATYRCFDGYHVTAGNLSRTCEAGGNWSGTEPTCTIWDCGVPPQELNSAISFNGTIYGEQVSYTCNAGYTMTAGNTTRTCGVGGIWSGTLLTCTIRDCGSLLNATDGYVTLLSGTTYGATATYTCNLGYHISAGNSTRLCQADGTWSGAHPTCTIYDCGSLTSPANGVVTTDRGTTFGQVAEYTCTAGYHIFSGPQSLVCGNGTWSGILPLCIKKDCGTFVNNTMNGVVTQTGTLFGDIVTITCVEGFMISQGVNNATIECTSNGTWAGDVHVCITTDCGNLPSPLNGFVDTSPGTDYLKFASYACNSGYSLVGPNVRQCQSNGLWAGIAPVCEIIDCGPLSDPTNGFVSTVEGTLYQATAIYSCSRGYSLTPGNATRVCQHGSIWNGTQPTCSPIECGVVGKDMIIMLGVSDLVSEQNFSVIKQLTKQLIYKSDMDSGGTLFGLIVFDNEIRHNLSVDLNIYNSRSALSAAVDRIPYRSSSSPSSTDRALTEMISMFSSDRRGNRGNIQDHAILVTDSVSNPTNALNQANIARNMGITLSVLGIGSIDTLAAEAIAYEPELFIYLATYKDLTELAAMFFNAPECDCGTLSNPADGTVDVSAGSFYNDEAIYSCNMGYQLSGSQTRICIDGQWSGTQPLCSLIQTTAPMTTTTKAPDLSDVYSCNLGYQLSGSQTRICRDGQWNGTKPFCNLILTSAPVTTKVPNLSDCDPLVSPTDGSVSLSLGTTVGSVATYTCNTGHRIVGRISRLCLANGTWEGTGEMETVCIIRDCGPLSNPLRGSVDTSAGTTFGKVATFICGIGYDIFGTTVLQCQADGTWSSSPPSCQIIDCLELASPEHGTVSASSTTFGHVATYSCNPGYQLSGTSSRMCQPDGFWSSQAPICIAKDCGTLPSPAFGSVTYSNDTTFGMTATYTCVTGYKMEGMTTRLCGPDGVWMGSIPTCNIADCGPLVQIASGTVAQPAALTYGAVAVYSCNTGFRMNGSASVSCDENSQWSSPPSCLVKDCGSLTAPDQGTVTTRGGTTYGQSAIYSCNTGYNPVGETVRVCTEEGTWSNTPSICLIAECGSLNQPISGIVTVSGTSFGDSARYICDAGHRMVGSPFRLCQADGSWIGSPPTCEIRDCGPLLSPINGNLENLAGTTFGSTATFSCNSQYNINGATVLVCRSDGTWSRDAPTCLLKVDLSGVDVSVSLNMTLADDVNLTNPATNDHYKQEVRRALLEFYRSQMGADLKDIVVNSVNRGSLITDFTIIMQKSKQAAQEFAVSTSNLVQGAAVTIFDNDVVTTGIAIEQNNVDMDNVTPDTVTCVAFLHAEGQCDLGYICLINNGNPSCQPDPSTDCGMPSRPSNGKMDASRGTLYGNTVIYTCNTGYTLVGDNTQTCQVDGNWAPATPTCQVTDCGSLLNPTNGEVLQLLETTYGNSATYTCKTGYSVIGATTVTCQVDGAWSEEPPTCRATSCGGLINPQYGTVSLSTDGRLATYFCNHGYKVIGSSIRTCLSTNVWSGSTPTCELIDCGSLSAPLNGVITVTGTVLDSVATYYCTTLGYLLSGSQIRTCEADGLWTGASPSCITQACNPLLPITNGELVVTGTSLGDTAQFTCYSGYNLRGEPILTCGATGWDHLQPICLLAGDCGTLSKPTNGAVNLADGTLLGAIATYICYTGYVMNGSPITSCLPNGTWSNTPPTCSLQDCGNIASPVGGTVDLSSGTLYGMVATYSCYSGYTLIGPSEVTCQQNGSWSYTSKCRIKDCGSLSNPLNGLVDTVAGTKFGSTAQYTCNPGYDLVGTSTRTCLFAGVWDGAIPTCLVKDCGSLVDPINGIVTLTSDSSYGQTATYSCIGAHSLNGTTTRQCGADGHWTGSSPTCQPNDCGSLIAPNNGHIDYSQSTVVGSMAIYTCDTGYVTVGQHLNRTCLTTGLWSYSAPVCQIVDCGSVSAPVFGDVTVIGGTVYQGSATYTCNSGYMIEGLKERTCGSDGRWSGNTPICIVTDCGPLDNPTKGRVAVPQGTRFGRIASYSCISDYSLDGSQIRTCQTDGIWSGSAPTCIGSYDSYALALGLGVGLSGFVILCVIIALGTCLLLNRKRSHSRGDRMKRYRPSRKYLMAQGLQPAPPLPMKINTASTYYIPYYKHGDDDRESSADRDEWTKVKYSDRPVHPSYDYNLPQREYYPLYQSTRKNDQQD